MLIPIFVLLYFLVMGYTPRLSGALGKAMLEDVLKASSNLTGSSIPSSGAANVIGLKQGKLNIAFSFSDTIEDAWEGKEDFKDVGKIQNGFSLS